MGLILDTDVLIRSEKQAAEVDFTRWAEHGEAALVAYVTPHSVPRLQRLNRRDDATVYLLPRGRGKVFA